MHAAEFYNRMIGARHPDWPYDEVTVQETDPDTGVLIGSRVPSPDRMEGARYAAHTISLEAVRDRVAGGEGEGGARSDFVEGEALWLFGGRRNCEDPVFVEGFILGAVGVWFDVKGRI